MRVGRLYHLPVVKIGRPKGEPKQAGGVRLPPAGGRQDDKAHMKTHANIGSVCPVVREIALMRVARGLGRVEFGDLTGYDRNRLYQWESGRNVPSVQAVENLANGLGMRLALVPMEGNNG